MRIGTVVEIYHHIGCALPVEGFNLLDSTFASEQSIIFYIISWKLKVKVGTKPQ